MIKATLILAAVFLSTSCALSARELEKIESITIESIQRYCDNPIVSDTGDASKDYKFLALNHLCLINKRRQKLELIEYKKAIDYSVSVSKGGKRDYLVDIAMWQSRGIALPSDMLGLK